MPIYEFKCQKCKGSFEVLVRSSDAKETFACPACHSKRTQRQLSAFSGKVGTTSGGSGCGSCAATSCGPS